jgi:hypothetical protein
MTRYPRILSFAFNMLIVLGLELLECLVSLRFNRLKFSLKFLSSQNFVFNIPGSVAISQQICATDIVFGTLLNFFGKE